MTSFILVRSGSYQFLLKSRLVLEVFEIRDPAVTSGGIYIWHNQPLKVVSLGHHLGVDTRDERALVVCGETREHPVGALVVEEVDGRSYNANFNFSSLPFENKLLRELLDGVDCTGHFFKLRWPMKLFDQ